MGDKKSDELGDRVKGYESTAAKAALDDDSPICVRLDGKAFHTFTRGLKRPYDERLSKAMIATMNDLMERSEARLGYTQSDEISLVFFKTAPHQQGYFGSRVQKLTSILASMATAKFNDEVRANIPEKAGQSAFFDCRAWNVPSLEDAADVFVWRQEDAIKNAVSMAARAFYSDKQLHGKNSGEKLSMLAEKGEVWEDYPEFFKTGTFAIRRTETVEMDERFKGMKGNEGKTHCLRSRMENFHMPRLRREDDLTNKLFAASFESKDAVVAERNRRKGKP